MWGKGQVDIVALLVRARAPGMTRPVSCTASMPALFTVLCRLQVFSSGRQHELVQHELVQLRLDAQGLSLCSRVIQVIRQGSGPCRWWVLTTE